MEFFLGSFITLVLWATTVRLLQKTYNRQKSILVRWSQSRSFELVKSALILGEQGPPIKMLKTQATKLHDQTHLRVVIWEGNAYWIKDNIFYTAQVVNGDVDQASAKAVDTMSMDKVQLDTMAFIVEKLTEGIADDRRSPGNS